MIGLDGLEPSIVERLVAAGSLPNMAMLVARSGLRRVATTAPAQTPVAWSTFATGLNPGGHGIFDFLRRNPETYLPDIGLTEFRQGRSALPPRPVNLRGGRALWNVLTEAGISSTVLRCPCTYPPDRIKGRLLSGLGVPDLRGGFGTSTLYTDDPACSARSSEIVIPVRTGDDVIRTHLPGPTDQRTGDDVTIPLSIEVDRNGRRVRVRFAARRGGEVECGLGEWSDWLRVKFRLGFLRPAHGMVRFRLQSLEPGFALYASPVNLDPRAPMFPISAPWDYAGELDRALGTFYTTGMVEDQTGLKNGRLDEEAFLQQCELAIEERTAHLFYELDRLRDGLLYCLFDTPDRIQHMFWRFLEPDHPANRGEPPPGRWRHVIDDHYRRCDRILGQVLERLDARTLLLVLSDHGFGTFRRGLHLNTWLHDNGFLALERGARPGEEAGTFFRSVDWSRTRAYSIGLGGIYLNRQGREASGIVSDEDAIDTEQAIIDGLTGLEDAARGTAAVRAVARAGELYRGEYTDRAPDLLPKLAAGYRLSWASTLGGFGEGHFEDNELAWSGDHVVDPALVPGALLASHGLRPGPCALADMAPTILSALGVPVPPEMEGSSVLGEP